MAEVQCQKCGKPFRVNQYRVDKAKFCSFKCKGEAQAAMYAKERITQTCPACGKEFSFPPCFEGKRKYCSTACSDANKEYCGPQGESHHMWKGGTAQHSGGYVYEICKGHPLQSLGNYVFQHRLVVERRMRSECPDHPFLVGIDGEKYLRLDIEVHHLNEARADNREANLVACTASGHHAFHHGLKVSKDQYWPNTVKPNKQHGTRVKKVCLKCHTVFEVPAYRSNTARYCSKTCFDSRAKQK